MPSLRVEDHRGRGAQWEIPAGLLGPAALAAIGGVRSMAAPALLADAIRRGEVGNLAGTPFARLGSERAASLLRLFMAGEMAGDKTPLVPSRVSAGPIFGRALSGALVGSALFVSGGRKGFPGALLGAASAVAGTFAADRARKWTTQKAGLPDTVHALLEDALVLFGGRSLLKNG